MSSVTDVPFAEQPLLAVRVDAEQAPLVSVTFLLSRTPAPHEAISTLVQSATLAIDLQCTADDLAQAQFTLEVASPISSQTVGVFGTAALAATLVGGEAVELLAALGRGHGGPVVRCDVMTSDGRALQQRAAVAEVVVPLLGAAPGRFVHLVSTGGGAVREIFPARAGVTRGIGPRGFTEGIGAMVLRDDSVLPTAAAVRPRPVSLVPAAVAIQRLDFPVLVSLAPTESGPIQSSEPLWDDRDGVRRWYVPEARLVVPSPGQDAETSPFRFDLTTTGHQSDGSTGLEALVRVTLAVGPSDATLTAWESAGRPAMKPVQGDVQVALAVPLRDERGQTRSELVTASSFSLFGEFGTEGSTIEALFCLSDSWARLAYGALSTPGFQSQSPAVVVTLTHTVWQRSSRLGTRIGEKLSSTKIMALRRAGSRELPAQQLSTLANAQIRLQPAAHLIADARLNLLDVVEYAQVRTSSVLSVPVVLPCADHGQLYRHQLEAGWEAIGCQPALRLGETEYRVWQPEPVTSVAGVRIYRSLTQPGRYLCVATNHSIGRYPASDPARAFDPTLLLTSTIDMDDPSNIRVVLAAALEPELTSAERAVVAAELRARSGREVELVTPWEAGLVPAVSWAAPQADSLECVAIDTGFTFLLSTDIPGLLTLKALLQRSGLVGSARWKLPGGDEAVSTLRLDLSRVVGPPDGPVTLARTGDEVVLHNHLDHPVSVTRLSSRGVSVLEVGQVIAGGAEVTVTVPVDAPAELDVDHVVSPSIESLDETRSYIEDLQLAVTFVAVADLSGVAGVEIVPEFLGEIGAPLTLGKGKRQTEVRFVLPLTSYATDPVLRFTVTAVATDGTRTTAAPVDWPVRTKGVLIPIGLPS